MSYIITDNNLIWGRLKRILNMKKGIQVKDKGGITTRALAREIVLYSLTREGGDTIPEIREVSDDMAALILRKTALDLFSKGKLDFYTEEMLKDPVTAREIYRIMKDIRLGEENAPDYSASPRLMDFEKIKDSFLMKLSAENIYDDARFLCCAVKLLEEEDFRKSFCCEGDKTGTFHLNPLTFMEEELEKNLGEANEVSRYSAEELLPEQLRQVFFYKAYGMENEIRFITKKIIEDKIPFGNVNIFYSSNAYEGYIKSVLDREGIPFSFVTGSAPSDGYITLIKDILDWAIGGYRYVDYLRIFRNYLLSDLCFGVKVHRDKEIGWGLMPYLVKSGKRLGGLREEKEKAEKDPEADEKRVKKVENRIRYYEAMQALTGIFADQESTTLSALYEIIYRFLKEYTKKKNKYRKKGLSQLGKKRSDIGAISEEMGMMSLPEALKQLREIIEGIRFTDSEKADTVSVAKIGGVCISERENHFFVGLSAREFTEKVCDSAVMSDNELRRMVKDPLAVAEGINEKREEDTKETIRHLSGNVYLSYCFFDTADILECSPADIFLSLLGDRSPEDIDRIGFDQIGFGQISSDKMQFESHFPDLPEPEKNGEKTETKKTEENENAGNEDVDNEDVDNEDVDNEDVDKINVSESNDDESDDDEFEDDEFEDDEFDDDEFEDDEFDDDEFEDDEFEDDEFEDDEFEDDEFEDDEFEDDEFEDDEFEDDEYDDDESGEDDTEEETEDSYEDDAERIWPLFVGKGKFKDLRLSASSIQSIINCKRAFLYSRMLYIPDYSEYAVESEDWLPPTVRGTYAHEILQRYFESVKDDTGKLPDDFDESRFLSVAESIYTEYRKEYPAHNDMIAEKKNKEYIDLLQVYLTELHEEFKKDGWRLLCMEGVFEAKDLINPEIMIESRMDRIDYRINPETNTPEYRIVDYKTGTKKYLEEKVTAEPPKQIQHELYMRVLDYCLRNSLGYKDEQGEDHSLLPGECKKTEYHFIFEEPENRKLECVMKDDVYNYVCQVVRDLFLNEKGVRLVNYQKLGKDEADDHCKYCSYKEVCRSAK